MLRKLFLIHFFTIIPKSADFDSQAVKVRSYETNILCDHLWDIWLGKVARYTYFRKIYSDENITWKHIGIAINDCSIFLFNELGSRGSLLLFLWFE